MELKPEDRALGLEIDREHAEELKQEERIVEALLFAMGRAVSLPEMAAALDADEVLAKAAAERLLQRYEAQQGGMLIRRVETAYQLCTNPICYDALIRVVSHPKKPVLSDVVLETLAIIAYKQPVTKAEIERIRGVQSDHAVNRLVEYGLVEESGRLNAPGRPALFVTTEEFLRRFGMESLKELPALSEDMAAQIEAQVAEEVSDVLGTDPETLQEELRNQRPETVVSAEAEEDNAVVPMAPAAPVKPAAPIPRKRETAPVRAAVEAERREEQEEAEAAASPVAPVVTAATVIGTAAAAVAESVAPQAEEKKEVQSEPETRTPVSEILPADHDVDAAETEEEPETDEKAAEVDPEDDEALEQMIYEAAVGTEPAAEQHYSFLEDDAEALPEAETGETAESDVEPEAVSDEMTLLDSTEDAVETDAVPETEFDDAEERSLPESPAVRTGTVRHHSIFDSVQVLSEAELAEIEEEERRFRESLTGLPPRKQKPDIEKLAETAETAAETAEADEIDLAEAESRESENTEAAAPENTESENTEAANAGGPES